MDLENFRNYCLALEGTTEKMPFGKFAHRFDSILVFYVYGHIYCLIDIADFKSITIKSDPETIEWLLASKCSTSSPRNMSPKYWIEIALDGDVSSKLILELVTKSYKIVKAKYLPKQ